jgi:ribonuclease VapC
MAALEVLDAYALLAYFEDEAGADQVRSLLLRAEEGKIELAMTVVNLGEVWYAIARADSAATADRLILEIQGMAIEVVEVDWPLTREAAALKAKGGVSYSDCFAAALAKRRRGEVVTADPEFKRLDGDVKIAWL